MKPFNLELAKAGHNIQTKEGHKARIVCYDVKGPDPILALIDNGDYEFEAYYDKTGRSDSPSLNLVMAPTKKEGWVNLYKDSNGAIICKFHSTKDEAISLQCKDCIATIKIEWEE